MQKWRNFVHTGTGHNKFWRVCADPNNPNAMLVHNGRLGTGGQHQKPKNVGYNCQWEIQNKINEKRAKGYREVDQQELDKLNTQAAIVGTANKCDTMQWVRREPTGPTWTTFTPVPDDILSDPSYDPYLLVVVTTKKEIAVYTNHTLIFSPEGSFHLVGSTREGISEGSGYRGSLQPITPTHPLHEITSKVEMALGQLYSGQ